MRERAAREGEGRREPISNSLLSVSVHRADWVERKEGSGYGRGNRCDHLHQWRIRISREKRIGKKNYHPSDSPPFYPLARSLSTLQAVLVRVSANGVLVPRAFTTWQTV